MNKFTKEKLCHLMLERTWECKLSSEIESTINCIKLNDQQLCKVHALIGTATLYYANDHFFRYFRLVARSRQLKIIIRISKLSDSDQFTRLLYTSPLSIAFFIQFVDGADKTAEI